MLSHSDSEICKLASEIDVLASVMSKLAGVIDVLASDLP